MAHLKWYSKVVTNAHDAADGLGVDAVESGCRPRQPAVSRPACHRVTGCGEFMTVVLAKRMMPLDPMIISSGVYVV